MSLSAGHHLQGIPENDDEIEINISETESLLPHRFKRTLSTPSVTPSTHSSSNGSVQLQRRNTTGQIALSDHHPFVLRRRSMVAPPQFTRMISSRVERIGDILSIPVMRHIPSRKPLFEEEDIYDVDEAIDAMGMGRFQWILFFIIGAVFFAYGMEVMLVAFLLPILQHDFGISALESTFIPLSSIIGAFIGAFVLSLLSDKYGRRKLIIFGVIMTAISGVASAFAEDLIQETIARFFVGFFMKIGVVAITLFAEFLPTKSRGKVVILAQTFWTLGLITSILLAWISLTYLNWRWYVKLSTIPLWIAVVGVIWKCPESAHYLIIDGQDEECLNVLTQISYSNDKPLPNGMLSHSDHRHESKEQRGNICDLFFGENASPYNTLLLLFVYIIYQSGYYGLLFVSVRYFAKLDSIYELHHEMYWEMLLTTFSEIPSIVIGIYLIDHGRSFTMNVAFALFSLSTYMLVFIDFEFNRTAGIILLFLSRMFISIGGMGAGVYFLEYYDTHIRATALGFAVSLSMVIKFGAIVIAETLHIMIAMYIFGTLGIFAFVASLLLEIDSPDTWFLLD